LGGHHGPKPWHERYQQCPYGQRDDARGNQRAFRSEAVHQRARWSLHENTRDPSDRERQPNALFVPRKAGEVNRKEWPDPRLNVGQKKIQPVQTAEGSPGRCLGIPSFRGVAVSIRRGNQFS
jgi:hypothetical protein